MASTNFINGTVIEAEWLNEVNDLVQDYIAPGTGAVSRMGADKLDDLFSVWDYIDPDDKAAIIAFTSTTDVTTELQAALTAEVNTLPNGQFRISDTLDLSHGLGGNGASRTEIYVTDNSKDAISVTDTSGEFAHIRDFRIKYPTKGTGDGVVLENLNNNMRIDGVNVQNADIGFNAKYNSFMQQYNQCRVDNSTVGFYAEGRSSGGSGAGTTLIYNQCYASNSTIVGWNLNQIRTVVLIQPTTDMGGVMVNPIVTTGVGSLIVLDHHFEGTPAAPTGGAYITYTTSGTLSKGVTVIGGAIENADISGLNYRYIDVNANDDNVKITLINVNVRNLTTGAFNYLAKLTGNSSSKVEIVTIGCDFGGLEGLFETSSFSGTLVYRKIETEKGIVASGTTSVAGGSTIDSGVMNTDAYKVFVKVKKDDGSVPTVMAHCVSTNTLSSLFTVRFTDLNSGGEVFGTHTVDWFMVQ